MPVGSVTIGGGGSAWMEDIVVVAGRICTRAFLVFSDLSSRDEACPLGDVEFTARCRDDCLARLASSESEARFAVEAR